MGNRYLVLLAIVMLGGSGAASALPLLSENVQQRVTTALTLYPDHEDPKKFYFMPNSSRFARDEQGKPVFSFTYWGLKPGMPLQNAGAYMVMVNRLKSDSDQEAGLKAFLKDHPDAGIAVLPVSQSIVSLATTGASSQPAAPLSKFYEEFNFSRVAGRAEDEVGVNAVLRGLGAKVMKTALTSPGSFKVDYYYKVQGLGPDMDAQITVKWDKVYDHFKTSFSPGYLWWRTDISVEVEKLKQNNSVSVVVNGGDAKDQEYVQMLTELIVKRLFVPEIQMVPGANNAGGDWSFVRVGLAATHREELKEESWGVKRRIAVEREFSVPIVVKDLAPYLKDVIKDSDAEGANR